MRETICGLVLVALCGCGTMPSGGDGGSEGGGPIDRSGPGGFFLGTFTGDVRVLDGPTPDGACGGPSELNALAQVSITRRDGARLAIQWRVTGPAGDAARARVADCTLGATGDRQDTARVDTPVTCTVDGTPVAFARAEMSGGLDTLYLTMHGESVCVDFAGHTR